MNDTAPQQRSALKQALLAIDKLQSRLDALEQARTEPVAIIGMACRFPGGATSPESFWRLLREGRNAITEVPGERFDVGELYTQGEPRPGQVSSRWGGFLEGVERFDAAFFGISRREAEGMDPQQRLLLEVTWEALEAAGQVPSRLLRSRTGVFMGLMSQDYLELLREQGGLERIDLYAGTGNSASTAAGRLSYFLGLQGPSVAVDTACSSSLVAVHLACQSLRGGESDLALAGGVNVILRPDATVMLSQARALSPQGQCKAFDASADGFVRSEGCAVVVLKRVSAALADGDPILAVIRGSAVNQDGRSSGLTVPNGLAQQELLRQALANARVAAADVSYVEAHGTGTPLGDPIEVQALGAVLCERRPADRPLRVGSVKTNLGHMEAAAGMGSLLKVVLALRHGELPPSLHLRTPNPRLGLEQWPVRIPTTLEPWEGPRLAGVSGFSLSGTNAHLVVGEAPERPAPARAHASGPWVLPLSARTPQALEELARRYEHLLAGPQAADFQEVCFTASLRRAHHPHRLALVAGSPQEARELLAARAAGESRGGLAQGSVRPGARRVAFLFPGQGSQWQGMARSLLETEPAFRSALEECEAAFRRLEGPRVLEPLRAGEALVGIDVIQPALFAVQVALCAWWRAYGVVPEAVVGHSMGEVAAACVAGALGLDDAARVIVRRSRLLRRVSGQGAMAMVELSRAQAEQALRGRESLLSVAVESSPASTVIAGDPRALESLLGELRERQVFCRSIQVDVASHSPQMEPLLGELGTLLAGLEPRAARVPLYSTVSGQVSTGEELEADYWVRNLRQPVLFASAVARLVAEGFDVLVEVSPHPVLLPAVEQVAGQAGRGGEVAVLPSLRRDEPERATLLSTLGALHTVGVPVDLGAQHPGGGRVVPLPAYPWQHERYWPAQAPRRAVAGRRGQHPLLGEHWALAPQPSTHVWQQEVEPASGPCFAEHRLDGRAVLLAAAYVEMALAAATQALGPGPHAVEELAFEQVLELAEGEPRRLQAQAVPGAPGAPATFQLASRPAADEAAPWVVHARATLKPGEALAEQAPVELAPVRARCTGHLSAQALYEAMGARGVEYGPAFHSVRELWRGPAEALGRLELPAAGHLEGPCQLEPALVDGCLQVLLATLDEQGGPVLPLAVGRLSLGGTPLPRSGLWAHARLLEAGPRPRAEVRLVDEQGQVLLHLEQVRLKRLAGSRQVERLLYAPRWQPAPRPEQRAARAARYLLLGSRAATEPLRQRLVAGGAQVVVALEGTGYRRVEPGLYSFDPEQPEHLRLLLRETGAETTDAVYLPGAQELAAPGHAGPLHLLQALAGQPGDTRAWLVTRGAQPVGGVSAPVAAAVWGLAESVRNEYPALRCTTVDVEEEAWPEALAAELLNPSAELRVALRGGERSVPRWSRQALVAAPPLQLHAQATYLVTGGLSGLGLHVAQWLARHGARHLVLLARSEPSVEARQVLGGLEASGVRVLTARVDVTEAAQVRALLARVEQELPPLRGLFHCAATFAYNPLPQLTRQELEQVLAPKLTGAWNLHQATLGLSLDCFVLFSSVAAQLGFPGSSAYAAANASLDALAHHRHHLGLPALSIAWGIWSGMGGAGTAAMEQRVERFAQLGVGSLTPDEGDEALGLLLSQPLAQVAVTPFEPARWRESMPGTTGDDFLAGLVSPEPRTASTSVRELLRTAESGRRRRALMEEHVREQVARVLRTSPARIGREEPLGSLGFDSLMALELRNRLEASLGLRLSATLVWSHPHLAALAAFLEEQLAPALASGPTQAPDASPSPSAAAQGVADLSDEEAEALLLERLDSLQQGKR